MYIGHDQAAAIKAALVKPTQLRFDDEDTGEVEHELINTGGAGREPIDTCGAGCEPIDSRQV